MRAGWPPSLPPSLPNCPMLACQQIFGPLPLARSSSSSSSFLPYMHLPFSLHPFRKQFRSLISLVFLPEVGPTHSVARLSLRPSELSPRKLWRAGLPLCDGNECGMHTERHVSSSNTYILSFLARIQPSLQTRLLLLLSLLPRLSVAAAPPHRSAPLLHDRDPAPKFQKRTRHSALLKRWDGRRAPEPSQSRVHRCFCSCL